MQLSTQYEKPQYERPEHELQQVQLNYFSHALKIWRYNMDSTVPITSIQALKGASSFSTYWVAGGSFSDWEGAWWRLLKLVLYMGSSFHSVIHSFQAGTHLLRLDLKTQINLVEKAEPLKHGLLKHLKINILLEMVWYQINCPDWLLLNDSWRFSCSLKHFAPALFLYFVWLLLLYLTCSLIWFYSCLYQYLIIHIYKLSSMFLFWRWKGYQP